MNTFRKITFLLLTCAAAGIFAPSCKSGSEKNTGTGEVDLRLNFKPGDKFLYSTKIDQKISLTQISMDQSMLMEMVYACTGEDSGNKKLSITYDHIVMNMVSPMGSIVYDSKSPQKNEKEMSMLDSLIGKSFSISVAPDGNIVKIEGLGDLIKSQSKSLSGSNEIAGQFSDSVVKQMMQNSFDIFPGKVVKIGESWSKKSQMGFSGMKVNVENTYVLKSIEGNKATIGVTSDMSLPKDTASATVQMTGKQEGTIDIDISSGQIISGKTTQDIKGTMSVMGQQMPMNIKGTISISSKKL
jgi:hypothetical protein